MPCNEVPSRAKRCTYIRNSGITKKAESQPGEREKFPVSMQMRRDGNELSCKEGSSGGEGRARKTRKEGGRGRIWNLIRKVTSHLVCPYETYHIARMTAI